MLPVHTVTRLRLEVPALEVADVSKCEYQGPAFENDIANAVCLVVLFNCLRLEVCVSGQSGYRTIVLAVCAVICYQSGNEATRQL